MSGRRWGMKTPSMPVNDWPRNMRDAARKEVEAGMNDLTGWQLTAVLAAIVVILAALYLIGCGDGCALP